MQSGPPKSVFCKSKARLGWVLVKVQLYKYGIFEKSHFLIIFWCQFGRKLLHPYGCLPPKSKARLGCLNLTEQPNSCESCKKSTKCY